MKKKTFGLMLLILVAIGCSSINKMSSNPTQALKLWTKQTAVQEAIEFEKTISNEYEILEQNVSLSKEVFPLLDKYQIANPFIVKRKQTDFLPLYAAYFFSPNDSILRYVSYDWEKDMYGNFFKKQEIWKEERTKLNEYNQEYERIKKELVSKFGEPISQDTEPQITKSTSRRGDYLSRNTVWENDKFYANLNMIFESMTYRIRLYYYWKK